VEIPPPPSMLIGNKNASLNWHKALGELIDNAFDAGALNVSVRFGPGRKMAIVDDGNGCSNPHAMLTIGHHHRQATTRLGRYGVGLKDAACWMWGITHIETTAGNQRYTMSINWPQLAKQTEWTVPDPVVIPCKDKRGTEIAFSKIDRPLPTNYERIAEDIGYNFTPGLLNGRQILLQFPRRKPLAVTPHKLPPLTDMVEAEFEVDGRGVRLFAGIVQEGHENRHPGFALCHYHRVITTTVLTKGFSCRHIAGQVFLDDKWHLSVHKDDISDHKEELEQAVTERCRDILEKAQTQSQALESQVFLNRLNAKLRDAMSKIAKRREKRKSPENKSGSVEPKNTGRKRRRAKNTQPGESMLSKEQVGKIQMDWKPCENGTLGEVDREGAVIWLNENNAYLRGLQTADNDDAILIAAIGMYVHAADESGDPQKYLPGMKAIQSGIDFVPTWAEVLGSVANTTE